MSLNEVNYQKVLADHDSFPPDLEIVVQTSDPSCSIQRQKFPCHRLLMSIASPYFRSRLRNPEDKWILFEETNPAAFKEVIDFIYHKRPFKIQNGGVGSSFLYIKLVLEVLCLAVKLRLPKLVKFCEEVVEKKITLTSANSRQVQDFLSSNEDVTLSTRNGLLLKYKSVARRMLIKAGVPPEERKEQLEIEMQRFATAANPDALSADYFNSSFRSAAPSILNQTARSMYYGEERSVANTTSRSVFHEEDEVEIVLDSSPPRMAVSHPPLVHVVSNSPQAVSDPRQEVEHSPQPPSPRLSPLQPQFAPQAASSSHQQLVSVASPSFLGCSASPLLDEGNLFDAYENNNSVVNTVADNPVDYLSEGGQPHQVPSFCSTPNPYLASESNAAPFETPRFASTPNPYLESEPNPEPTPMDTSSPSFEELVLLVKNIKKLDSSQQQNVLEHIRKLERENPSLVRKVHEQLMNPTNLQ